MNNEKWNEICFLLYENIKTGISENAFEQNVIQALSVLGWKEYLNDFNVRPSFQIGASNRITPDFVIKSQDNKKLFVIEIKQPNIKLASNYKQQLFSYMRQLKLEYGILIGENIQLFYDGNISNKHEPILLEVIKFERGSHNGENFVELFTKNTFSIDKLEEFTLGCIKKINQQEVFSKLKNHILSDTFGEELTEIIKQHFLNEYDEELIDKVIKELHIEIKNKTIVYIKSDIYSPKPNIQSATLENGILPIELSPPNEFDFKKQLLAVKRAVITTFYTDGSNIQKIWNANRFSESSGVLNNLRSRSEFRNGEWQKRGITKVYVSIES